MENGPLKSLFARLRFSVVHAEWPWLVAALLALLAMVLHGTVLPGREAAIEAGEQRLAQLERQTRRLMIAQRENGRPEQVRLGLLERFSDGRQLPSELERLHGLAAEAGVQLDSADYRLIAGKDQLFERYAVNLPIRGSYRAVRDFLVTVRSEFPYLAIEEVALKREKIGQADLEAQVRLVLYLRRPEGV